MSIFKSRRALSIIFISQLCGLPVYSQALFSNHQIVPKYCPKILKTNLYILSSTSTFKNYFILSSPVQKRLNHFFSPNKKSLSSIKPLFFILGIGCFGCLLVHTMMRNFKSRDEKTTPLSRVQTASTNAPIENDGLEIQSSSMSDAQKDISELENFYSQLKLAFSQGKKEICQSLLETYFTQLHDFPNLHDTPLHFAAKYNDLAIVQFLVTTPFSCGKMDINAKNSEDKTPLHIATQGGFIDIARYLIDKDADIHAVDKDGNTVLHLAAKKGFIEIANHLIGKGAQLELKDNRGFTPLLHAVCDDQFDMVTELINHGSNIYARGKKGCTALHITAEKGSIKMTNYLIDKGAYLELKDKWGFTPLLHAVCCDQFDVAKLFIEKGADIYATNNAACTALHFAAETGSREIANYLIDKGVQLELKDKWGYTPLLRAVCNEKIDVIKLFIEKDANIYAADPNDCTALHLAAQRGFIDIARYLIKEKNMSLELKDTFGNTPLLAATQNDELKMVTELINHGANIYAADQNDCNALHIAAKRGFIDIASYLIEKKMPLESKDKFGNTPLLLATENKQFDMVTELIKHGADSDAANKNGSLIKRVYKNLFPLH